MRYTRAQVKGRQSNRLELYSSKYSSLSAKESLYCSPRLLPRSTSNERETGSVSLVLVIAVIKSPSNNHTHHHKSNFTFHYCTQLVLLIPQCKDPPLLQMLNTLCFGRGSFRLVACILCSAWRIFKTGCQRHQASSDESPGVGRRTSSPPTKQGNQAQTQWTRAGKRRSRSQVKEPSFLLSGQ